MLPSTLSQGRAGAALHSASWRPDPGRAGTALGGRRAPHLALVERAAARRLALQHPLDLDPEVLWDLLVVVAARRAERALMRCEAATPAAVCAALAAGVHRSVASTQRAQAPARRLRPSPSRMPDVRGMVE